MASKRDGKAASFVRLASDIWAFQTTAVLAAALELDVFSAIGSGKRTSVEIASATNSQVRGMERLLDTLTSLKYLKKTHNRYGLEPIAATFLVRESPMYMEGASQVIRGMTMLWSTLADAVKAGASLAGPVSEDQARAFFPILVKQIFPMNYTASQSAIRKMPKARLSRIQRILDIGGGAAAWSIPFAENLRKARATLIDYPEMTAIAREYAARFKVGDRFDFLEGNFFEIDWGSEQFDLAILGHIVHGEGVERAKQLMRRACIALKPGGILLIADFIPNENRTGPALALMFGLNMFVATPEGGVYTMGEYRAWLKEAGFKRVTTVAANAPSPLILAHK
ncbi:MAG: class I SAM-dependent methyltransferase [Candidatus Binatus sp.]|uniref:class I SAM-dependent methyltransferase n=1 Tax=Candidatus Binatus sp. TaxID=2811406 RepID=UPI0027243679|nr:class I SAM-dependent methyltransferase [Candidatus Binatus sp.]MDO8434851.1 class I SAM-dependent methyltransferase [Candidatus Binatus sp.]